MRLISWNVNGIRAAVKKDFIQSFHSMNPDVLCLQETKAQDDQVLEALSELEDWHIYSYSAERKGYSGTAIISKTEPLAVSRGIGIPKFDDEGRVTTAEFNEFFLVTTYVPNSGNGLVRLDYRQEWDKALLAFCKNLEKKKPVVLCGDMNVCHKEIDIARAKANYNKSAGYMQEEIDGMDNYVSAGFVDSFRAQNPEETCYSWWSYRAGARGKNIGWRLDYFLISESFMPKIKSSFIRTEVLGSDHCPVGVDLS